MKRWKLENGGPSICEYIIYFSIFLFVNYDYDYDNSPHSPWLRLGMHCRTTERRGEVVYVLNQYRKVKKALSISKLIYVWVVLPDWCCCHTAPGWAW